MFYIQGMMKKMQAQSMLADLKTQTKSLLDACLTLNDQKTFDYQLGKTDGTVEAWFHGKRELCEGTAKKSC
jgi:hypothetical protein